MAFLILIPIALLWILAGVIFVADAGASRLAVERALVPDAEPIDHEPIEHGEIARAA